MSTEPQETLASFVPESDDSLDATDWLTPGEPETSTHCLNCGSHVTPAFARVNGDQRDRVWHCLSCVCHPDIIGGAAADPEFESRVENGAPPTRGDRR